MEIHWEEASPAYILRVTRHVSEAGRSTYPLGPVRVNASMKLTVLWFWESTH
jgi:hypothetical protein